MNAEQKRVIKSTILECRDILEKDMEQVLINYGIYVNREWVNLRDLKNLNEEQEKIREKVEKAVGKFRKGGFDKEGKAVIEYIKEVSYTYLNRLAALRVMEVRGLIDEILIPRSEYGNRSFVGSRFYEVAREYCKYEMDGGLAYLLGIMFKEIGEEIKMLFSTEDEYSLVTPSSTGLLKVTELLCANIDEESWKQDEIIGWIYQYFNDKEKDDVFDRLYNKKQKIRVEDIPAATQLFTPDWIVDWIVDNSLGTLWDEIKQGKRENRRVGEIKLLDPCCGSGHFLVKAYDLFYNMYVEEGEYTEEEIPYKILENNLYGVDIDLRAIQLTGLILFLKTKTYLKNNGCDVNTKGKLSVNLVCADSILLNGNRLEELKRRHKDNKIIQKMIEIIYEEFQDVRLKGSLIQPEKKIIPLFEEFKDRKVAKELRDAKKTKKKQTKGQENLLEDRIVSPSEYKSQRDFTREEKELVSSLDFIYAEAIKANDISRQLFASEARKSVKLVDIFMKQYDVVVTNPPYMGKRNMNRGLRDFIDKYYLGSNFDLYSVFIRRCAEFTKDKGFLGMITQQTFMFTKMFKKLRQFLLDNFILSNSVHLGTRVFSEIFGEKVNNVMFVYKKEAYKNSRDNEMLNFIDLRMYKTGKEKSDNLVKLNDGDLYKIEQKRLRSIEDNPFIYWIPDSILDLFHVGKKLDDKSESPIMYSRKGLTTGYNSRFLRFHWEIKEKSLGKKWFMLSKGETDRYYYFEPTYVVNWENNGHEIKNFRNEKGKLKSRPQNIKFYFKEGLTYTLLGGNNFKVRYMEKGNIFEANGPCIFPNKTSLLYAFGFLNSALCREFLYYVSPTLAINISDIDKLPFIHPSKEIKSMVEQYSKQIINISKDFTKFNELNKKYFVSPELVLFKSESLKESIKKYLEYKYLQEIKILLYTKLINDLIYKVYGIDKKTIDMIAKNQMDKFIDNIISDNDLNFPIDEEIMVLIRKFEFKQKIFDSKRIESQISDMAEENISLNKMSQELDVSVFSIYKVLIKKPPNHEMVKLVKNLISYFVGEIMGRFSSININRNSDGISPIDASIYLERDMGKQLYGCLCEVFGSKNSDNIMDEIEEVLGVLIEQYLKNQFFKEHKNLYRKRPIYWHICSPKKTFNCFVYYHRLDHDTLYKVKNIYLKQMVDRYGEDLKYYTGQLIEVRVNGDRGREKALKDRCSDLEAKLEDLNILDEKIVKILPYKPDIDEGVLYNIIPVEPILSGTVSTKKERENYYKKVGGQ